MVHIMKVHELLEVQSVDEGIADVAQLIAQKIGAALASFRKTFHRAPTPKEMFGIRKKLRDAVAEKSSLGADKTKKVQHQRTTSRPGSASQGASDVQDWLANI